MNPRYYYPCEVGRAMTADARSPTELARDSRQRSRNLHSLGALARSSYQTVGKAHTLLESPRFSHARSGGRPERAAVMQLSEPHRGACCARIPCPPFHSLTRTPCLQVMPPGTLAAQNKYYRPDWLYRVPCRLERCNHGFQ